MCPGLAAVLLARPSGTGPLCAVCCVLCCVGNVWCIERECVCLWSLPLDLPAGSSGFSVVECVSGCGVCVCWCVSSRLRLRLPGSSCPLLFLLPSSLSLLSFSSLVHLSRFLTLRPSYRGPRHLPHFTSNDPKEKKRGHSRYKCQLNSGRSLASPPLPSSSSKSVT